MACTFLAGVSVLHMHEDTRLIREAHAQTLTSAAPKDLEKQPVDLVADSLEYDETGQIITASGDVELVQAGRILRAQQVSYNLSTDTVYAQGDVVLTDTTGDVYFADEVELAQKMKDGFVLGLQGLLTDGSRFTAERGERIGGTKLVMHDATYTACEICESDPSKPPDWQLVAETVTHDEESNTISYKNARFELGGVPVAYVPFFSHPDGTVKRKSGLLTPTVGFDSELGTLYQQEYYWAIAPDKDATIGTIVSTKENPVLLGEYRQRFENAIIDTQGSITYSQRKDSVNGVTRTQDDEVRGHIFSNALWDINDKWRAGWDIALTSDDQYMRQYDITNEDVLDSTIYAERFSGRDYTIIQAQGYQDIRVSDRQTDQPALLPEVVSTFVGDPNSVLGGRLDAELSTLNLYREGDKQDLTRGTVDLGWQRRFISRIGLVSTLDLTARGDAYSVRDREIATEGSGRSSESSEIRGFSQANFEASYPVKNSVGSAEVVVEPVGSVTLGTNVDFNNDIPNEDSQDVFVDPMKLFEPNRFPGYDKIEDKSRVTYGLRTGVYLENGYRTEAFLGQSRRLEDDDNPFPDGSGLSEQESDYVGQITASFGSNLNLNYNFQLENDSFASQRHEVTASGNIGRLSLNTRYFYAAELEGTDFTDSREQIRTGGRYRLTDQWSVHGSARYDFSSENPGLRQATYGVDYYGQCINVSLTGKRTLTRDSSGDSGTEVLLRIGLRNLGEFETSGINLGLGDDDE